MEKIERPKEVIRAERSVQSNEFIQKNMQSQLYKIYDFLDKLVDQLGDTDVKVLLDTTQRIGNEIDVVMNDSSANYTRIKIFYHITDVIHNSTKHHSIEIYKPDGKTTEFDNVYYEGSTYTYILTRDIHFSGNTISSSYCHLANQEGRKYDQNVETYIDYILGYK